jgi:hypothetical protein
MADTFLETLPFTQVMVDIFAVDVPEVFAVVTATS